MSMLPTNQFELNLNVKYFGIAFKFKLKYSFFEFNLKSESVSD